MAFMTALGIAVVTTPISRSVGLFAGLVDRPDVEGLKIHRRPVPLTGGSAVVASVILALWLVGRVPSVWILGAVGVAFLAGLIDDVLPLPAILRLLAHVGAGLLLLGAGLRIETVGMLGAVATVLLVAATANAVNIMDGQDGLVGGLGAVAALGFALLLSWHGDSGGVALALATAGALGGFLVLNRPPARIFLGNAGAYAVGVLLAVLAARLAAYGWQGLLAAGVCLGLFAFELAFTIVRRLMSRRPMVGGDRAHSYDLVAQRTGERPRTTAVFVGLGVLVAGLALVVDRAPLVVGATITAATAAGAAVWAWGLWADYRRRLGVV